MTYKRDPRVAIGDTDYASAAGNPGDIANLTAGATSAFLQIIAGLPAWRTTVQATASLALATQTLKGLLDASTFNRISAELINYVTNPNFQADTAAAAAASWTATNATQICSTSGPIINTKSMRISPSATLTGTVDGDLNTLDGWVNTGGTDKTLSLTFLSYGDTDYLDNEISFVIWNSTDSVEVAGTTSTIPLLAKYHKVSWVPATGKVYKLRFKTTVVATTHRIFVDSFVCSFEQERTANTFLSGPASGTATVPTFRAIVGDDLAATPTATKVLTAAGTGNAPTWETPAAPTLSDNSVTLAKLVNASAQGDFLARKSASGGAWEDCTATQATALLDEATDSVKGLLSAAEHSSINLTGYTKYPSTYPIAAQQLGTTAIGNSAADLSTGQIRLTSGTWMIHYTLTYVNSCTSTSALASRFAVCYNTDASTTRTEVPYSRAQDYTNVVSIQMHTISRNIPINVTSDIWITMQGYTVVTNGTCTLKNDANEGYCIFYATKLNGVTGLV